MPEEALDLGTTVMVMQVSCKDPGCVPLETAVIIVFPNCGDEEMIPGLPESNGGSYKTKILKPMANVTDDDILDNLPPAFKGGRRTMERVCMYARDVMIAQITQLFGDGSEENDSTTKDRTAMALFLQSCLQDYIAGGCKPPPLGEPFINASPTSKIDAALSDSVAKEEQTEKSLEEKIQQPEESSTSITSTTTTIPYKGNIVIRRKMDNDTATKTKTNGTTTSIRIRQPPKHERAIQLALNQQELEGGNSSIISRLFEREHAPGIRKPGCPCCDPNNPTALADSFMMF
eukprot:CAMPEP_0168188096 /NCGR_PEP_ID=MMETSP0139_2-20121125/15427_1 /TAXON_ID=44445 /ORGANISM="Pseudo-nitzschia australis, Strain 10249 10 AB" /LENGTH=288 /DNA_ID=CAMNT_0008110435 /DNA_START=92 /DNA_END=958 /DNA_ORIENTATION=-